MVLYDPSVWGPHYWFFLDTIAMTYPKHPNAVTKKIYYDLIQHFHLFIPVDEHSKFFNKLLSMYPITPYLDDRESFIRWVHFIHNKINERIQKPNMPYNDFYTNYYQHYKNKLIQNGENKRFYNKLLFCSLILILLFSISYLSKI
jgi:hypothetical protein|uniref:thiol oxidase n=1 Tax=viral metagenome TaxID=1070528 RepID=A0A6C0IKJ2_9ZZZZ